MNTLGILIGGLIGLVRKTPMSAPNQYFFKAALGAFTVFYGLRLTWISVNGSFLQILKQVAIVVLAMMLGKIAGRLMQLQKTSNRLGQYARERIASAKPGDPRRLSDGFSTCAALFCAAPLGILGAVHDGLSGYYYALAVKAVMDGLAAMGFISIFGWGVLLSALPVLAFQGTIAILCAQFAQPLLKQYELIDSVNATGGLLIFCVALLIFEIKKIHLADYLPSLIFAPLLTWLLR